MARILVIDDQEDIRKIIKKYLTLDGHEVDTAKDGKEGMKLADEQSYQIVITDILMPEKDGLEVLQDLKNIYIGMGIIVITGGSPRVDIHDLEHTATIMGADRVLLKVLDYNLLRSTVKELLESYS